MVLGRQHLLRRQRYYSDAYCCGGGLFHTDDGDNRHSSPRKKSSVPFLMSESGKGAGRGEGGDEEPADRSGKQVVAAEASGTSVGGGNQEGEGEAEKDDEEDWLSLTIGVGAGTGTSSSAAASGQRRKRARSPDISLSLDRPAPSAAAGPSTSVSIDEALTWRLWDPGPSTEAADLQRETAPYGSTASTSGSTREAQGGGGEESSADIIRAVSSRPTRPQTGIWLSLVAAANQAREPHLPQIPRSYLRVRDERTTVEVLMKYIANKLGLSRDIEVEMTCRSQHLHPSMTLQYVRDNLWCSLDLVPSLPPDSPADVVMILQYGRSSIILQPPTSV